MDKISIVKRRQQNTSHEVKDGILYDKTVNINSEEAQNDVNSNTKTIPEKKMVEEFNNESGHVISIIMTSEQSSMLQSSEYIRDLLSGRRIHPSLNLNRDPDGRIVFNFCLHESSPISMLQFDQVCQMLQISRSSLRKLVHEKKLKSYKLGRLRRFGMEDILNYLSSNEELIRHIGG